MTLHPAMSVSWLVGQSVGRLVDPLLGSGPEGVDDIRFHTCRDFSPSPSPPSSLKSQSWGPNPSLKAQILVWSPRSQPRGSKHNKFRQGTGTADRPLVADRLVEAVQPKMLTFETGPDTRLLPIGDGWKCLFLLLSTWSSLTHRPTQLDGLTDRQTILKSPWLKSNCD